MICKDEPYLIEYNIRMGDPECQVILPRLQSDLLNIILKVVNNKLKNTIIRWHNKKSMTIVLCAKGYPGKYKKNLKLNNIDKIKLKKNELIFHAGTKYIGHQLVSNGGRVLNITSVGNSYLKIRNNIISLLKK